jgi:hypothetical protein
MLRSALVAFVLLAAAPVAAEPVENGSEIAQLLEALGDRCWAVDLDGAMLDAAALAEVAGPVDIELECVIEDAKVNATKPLPATVI